MGKAGNFFIVFLILTLLAAGNIYLFFTKTGISISGFAMSDFMARFKKPGVSTILFIAQWVVIILVVVIFSIKFLKKRKEEKKEITKIKVKREKGKGKAHTDLDTLYDLLKSKKNLKLSAIAKTFKINKEQALAWSKILEKHDLARIEYPAFSEPEVNAK
jgi:hypothetical protein